jgi:hypothetical protein
MDEAPWLIIPSCDRRKIDNQGLQRRRRCKTSQSQPESGFHDISPSPDYVPSGRQQERSVKLFL